MCGRIDRWRSRAVLAMLMIGPLAAARTDGLPVPNEPTVPTENPSSSPNQLYAARDALYFSADDGIHGRELWMWQPGDRSRGRVSLAADIVPGQGGSDPVRFAETEGWLYFVARSLDYAKGKPVWAWHADHGMGWIAGPPGHGYTLSDAHFFGSMKGRLLFSAYEYTSSFNLFAICPGTWKGVYLCTLPTTPTRGGESPRFAVARNRLFFYSSISDLGYSDGTSDGTRTFYDFHEDNNLSITGAMGPLNHCAAFVGLDEQHGREPWITDGTKEGTRLIKDIAPGKASSDIREFAAHSGTRLLYFGADDVQHGKELWKTDGSPDGTALVKDINRGRANSNPYGYAEMGPWLYFLAEEDTHGKEVWRTDGTGDGTAMVVDLFPGLGGSRPWRLTVFAGRLFFCANSPTYGEEVFVTDGTAQGTHVLKDIVHGPGGSGPHNLTVFRDWLFFTCDDGVHGEELWISDGTDEGTRLAADIHPLRFNPPSRPAQLTASADRLFFTVSDREHGEELWVSDGTRGGTAIVRDVAPGQADSAPRDLCAFDDGLLFFADDGVHGREIWCSDGTGAGTIMVSDITEGPASTACVRLEAQGRAARFEVLQADGVTSLWETDGTTAGTRCLLPAKAPKESHEVDRRLAAPTGNARIGDIGFFVRHTLSEGSELWRTGESGSGTQIVRDLYPGPAGSSPSHLCAAGKRLYFAAEHPVEGRVLWCTDGTSSGTDCVRLGTGSGGAFFVPVIEAVALSETLVLSSLPVVDPESQPENAELRFLPIDPTAAHGGDALFNVRVGPAGSWPRQLTRVGQRVFFTADDGVHGEELWVTDGTQEGTHLVRDILRPSDLSTMPR